MSSAMTLNDRVYLQISLPWMWTERCNSITQKQQQQTVPLSLALLHPDNSLPHITLNT